MTNENMVRTGQSAQDGKKAEGTKGGAERQVMPEPNPPLPTPLPAPESDPQLFVTHDPADSPQPKPMINQDKTKGLKAEQ